MTDYETVRTIAINVLGHEVSEGYPIQLDFDPITSDNDCMMAWDKFSKGKLTTLSYYKDKEWLWEACYDVTQDHCILAENPSRRRAMCGCMVAAIGEETTEKGGIK